VAQDNPSGLPGPSVTGRRKNRRLVRRVITLGGALLVGAGLVAAATPTATASASGAQPHAVHYLALAPRAVPAPDLSFTVNTTADTHDATPGDGTCADSGGNCSLRAAVEEANALQKTVAVDVPAGTYLLTIGTVTTTDVAGLVITGAGADSTVIDASGASASVVTVAQGPSSGGAFTQLDGVTLQGGNASDGGGITVVDSNDTAELNGVTVTHNAATSEGGGAWVDGTMWATDSTFSNNTAADGGGVYNPGGNMRLTNCTITGNTATSTGGGVDASDGTSVFTGGSITGNQVLLSTGSSGSGGGIYAYETTMSDTVVSGNKIGPQPSATGTRGEGAGLYTDYGIGPYTGLTVTGNTIDAASTGSGAGVYDREGVSLTDSTISNNTLTNGDGGGIYNDGQGEVLTNDVFSGNNAFAGTGEGWGGGLYEYDTATITNTVVSGNHADTAAGGIYNDDALFVTGTTISGNTSIKGAGLYTENKSQFENSTFANNVASGTANAGGAIWVEDAPISLNYVTLSGNVADSGAGIYDSSAGGVIGSSILWGNLTSAGTEAECAVAATEPPLGTAGHNVFGDSSCTHGSLDQVGVNALIGPLGNNGGATQTFLPKPGSPALGIGGGSCPATDQRGVGRPHAVGCDSGAVQTQGYVMAASDGGIFNFGTAGFFGSMGGKQLNQPIVGIAVTPDGKGYWEVASDGGIFSFGSAGFFGSMGGKALNKPIVGIAAAPDGMGYWEVASDGGIFNFGSAGFFGSMGGKALNKPIVGIAAAPDGMGYWEVASDGGIFNFGSAGFFGSMGGTPLNKPIVGIAAAPDGMGYWEVASDGGIFNFGSAAFLGSMGGMALNKPVVGIAATAGGSGYWEVASDGGIFTFGDAQFLGSMGGAALVKPVVGIGA